MQGQVGYTEAVRRCGWGGGGNLEASELDLCFQVGRAETLRSTCSSPKPAPAVGVGNRCIATQQTALAHPL